MCRPDTISHWNFDEGSGNVLYDTVRDNDGTINGATFAPGINGTALYFDGTDSVIVPDDDSLDVTGSLTLSAWVKAEGNILQSGAI